jgi:hypothetical protein
MCVDCQRRAVTNPLRVFDCKVPEDQPIIETLPRISGFLDEADRQHFDQVQAILKATNVPFMINDRLVRGLDYYTRTAFEFTQGSLGAQNAILGGGRYDGLSEALEGPRAPGIGFAIGEDRFVMALAAGSETASSVSVPQAYIAPLGEGMNVAAAKLASELRSTGVRVELGDESFRLKKAFETAEKLGIKKVVIVGENEVASDQFAVKDLDSGNQENIERAKLGYAMRALDNRKIPDADKLLRTAILQKRLIRFNYAGKVRIAEPHDYGVQKGLVRLFCYQVGGESNSGSLPDWRLLEVPEMSDIEVLNETFPGSRSIPTNKHQKWDQVFERVAA